MQREWELAEKIRAVESEIKSLKILKLSGTEYK